jgi:hypothetical protein
MLKARPSLIYVGDIQWVLVVHLAGRVAIYLFQSLRMHRVHLDDPHRFIHKVMNERLCVGSGRLIADDDLVTVKHGLVRHDQALRAPEQPSKVDESSVLIC